MLKNLVMLVTGGASGLGLGTVSRFANKGSRVVFCDLPTSKGEEISKQIGENVQFIPADVRSEDDIKNLFNEISKKYGKLDAVVNCAGIYRTSLVYNGANNQIQSVDDFKNVLMTNAVGTFNVCRFAADLMSKNECDADNLRGVIVNTSGMEAFKASMGETTNSAASGAIHSMTKPMASEFGKVGIRVVSIAPAFIQTPMLDNIAEEFKNVIYDDYEITARRPGDPDEFAYLVQTIIQNPYLNATTIELNGGLRINI